MIRPLIRAVTLTAFLVFTPLASAAPAGTPGIERMVLVMRHGVRTPLHGEVPDGTRTGAPWPEWKAPDEQITPHGAKALRALGEADRRWFAAHGLIAATGCPDTSAVRIRANISPRTIESGRDYADGLAPGCALPVSHRMDGGADPLFEPLSAHPAKFDADAAVASIRSFTGGPAALAERHRAGLTLLETVLACPAPGPCSPVAPSAVVPTADGHGISLTGPIRAASGTAQVLMLEYLEGFPLAKVGWGRATPDVLKRLGAVHGALFDVFSRPPYMTAFQMAPTVDRILRDFTAKDAPRIDMLVGHDTNVAALGALLQVPVEAPGFAKGDPSPGGALALALVRQGDGNPAVKVWYRSQSAQAIRAASDQVQWTPLAIPGCDEGADHLCPLPRFKTLILARTAAARE
ncbi:histidine-type phosphatase [Stakelama pacifica]|uniref:4-phytase/acid phosphatase n=1 Tax=Stakelama pacifica TaxID=517720 RepID=A0A4R6FP99_9SPHN|nr:histidine-type phosphatase [Stakelama pacifica]TDN82900.1 4-phytase/acid phosphatase [Stakelama pacifica]GGO95257.1 phosphoanhydride phosphohydrolase [Stakelama pacifica]